jgi:glucose uptake protein GlcU
MLLLCVLCSSEWRILFIAVGGRWSAEAAGASTAAPLGTAAPMLCHLSSWTILMLAPWSVMSRCILGRFHRIHRFVGAAVSLDPAAPTPSRVMHRQ